MSLQPYSPTPEEYQQVKSLIESIDNDPLHTLPEGVTAVLKDAYRFPAGGIHGSIYYDQHKRFEDGHQVHISTLESIEPGGIYKTKNSTYLVLMIEPQTTGDSNG